MKIKIDEVPGLLRIDPLTPEDNIEDDFNLENILLVLEELKYYWRDKNECPFERGNLVVDLISKGEIFLCLKFPYETTVQQIESYLKPLITKMKLRGELFWKSGKLHHIN